MLGEARVPAGRVYTAKDIVEDPHYRARDMILQPAGRATATRSTCPASCPSCSARRARVRSSAPKLGDDTDAVLRELGFSDQDIAALRGKKVVA